MRRVSNLHVCAIRAIASLFSHALFSDRKVVISGLVIIVVVIILLDGVTLASLLLALAIFLIIAFFEKRIFEAFALTVETSSFVECIEGAAVCDQEKRAADDVSNVTTCLEGSRHLSIVTTKEAENTLDDLTN